jgi:nucleoside-diphosphate-sugar epimerase
LLDISRVAGLGWRARIDLTTGLQATYDWYRMEGAK